MIILLCIILTIVLICDSTTAVKGALAGLSLWYNNVIPLLLPFMLISNVMVSSISKSKKLAIPTTLFLGLFCGYPLGAKTITDFVNKDAYSHKTGNIILPLCNNTSPVFLSGYIINNVLYNKISLYTAIFLIYFPYLLITLLQLIHYRIHEKSIKTTSYPNISTTNYESEKDNIIAIIRQITYVGFYIILCSIAIEFIMHINMPSKELKFIIAGITEITRGSKLISQAPIWGAKIKTALILSITSFGGISSILQTNKVINSSRLSIYRYIIIKALCSIGTYLLTILLI